MGDKTYPLARQGVFRTVQGEGALLGLPMVFIRLAGCSVNCDHCDTDYRVASRATAAEVAEMAAGHAWGGLKWAWVTGGEPLDHDVTELTAALWGLGLKVALATAGAKWVSRAWRFAHGIDFLSVSPHDPVRWVQRQGDQLNLVPGLNGLSLTDPSLLDVLAHCEGEFAHRHVTPMADREGRPTNLDACRRFIDSRPGWRLGVQAHKVWGVA